MTECAHLHRAGPPPGRTLPVCLDCLRRLIECSRCGTVAAASPQAADSGWTKRVQVGPGDLNLCSYHCPVHD